MALTWEQFLRAPIRSLPRSGVVVPVAVSLAFHAGLLIGVVALKLGGDEPRYGRLTDAPTTETVLALPPTPVPVAQPQPELDPVAEAQPPPAPEPVPEVETPPVVASSDVLKTPVEPAAPVVHEVAPTVPVAPSASLPAAKAPIVPTAPVEATPTPVSFAGVEGARARKVVYVVDASGAMTSSLKFVKEELVRSIARLDSSQSFQIVVVRDPVDNPNASPVEVFTNDGGVGLVPASGQTRLRAAAWLEKVQPHGRSDPLAGLTAALKLKPDLVFLLTRSIRRSGSTTEWGKGSAATLEALEQLNPPDIQSGERLTVIKAIQFLDEDPTGLLQAIARVHGDGPGSYRVLKVNDLK